MEQADLIWMNGEFVAWEDAKVHVLTHALHYGTACFEGIRGYWNERKHQLFVLKMREHIEKMATVVFQGGGDAVKAVLAGTVQLNSGTLAPALPHIKAGTLTALAQTGTTRFVGCVMTDTSGCSIVERIDARGVNCSP